MTNGSLMKVKSIAECSFGAFCNTYVLNEVIIMLKPQFLVFCLSSLLIKTGLTVIYLRVVSPGLSGCAGLYHIQSYMHNVQVSFSQVSMPSFENSIDQDQLAFDQDPHCFPSTRYRGSYMSDPVLLNLLNKLGKSDKMQGFSSLLSLFCNKFNKFNNTGA